MSSAIQNDLTDSSTHCWRLLYTMATETISKDEIVQYWMGTYDSILVECVVLIVASPGTLYLHECSNRESAYHL